MQKKKILTDGESGKIETPFDIENILKACPKLLSLWLQEPFYFDIDKSNRVIVVYLDTKD